MTKAIGLKESGLSKDCHYAKGGSGESYCYQLMPNTWKQYSKDILGYVDLNPTPTTVEYVVTFKIQQFVNRGWKEAKIALAWNGGEGAKKCHASTNDFGQKYDSCDYVEKVLANLNK